MRGEHADDTLQNEMVLIFALALTGFACGPGDNCKKDADCQFDGSRCLTCGPAGYCISGTAPSAPLAPSPPGTPSAYDQWLSSNIAKQSGMPLSYEVFPADYFTKVPDSQKSKPFTNATRVPQCGDIMV